MAVNKTLSLNTLRREFKLDKLSERTVQKSPFNQFEKWFKQVMEIGIVEPNAMILATADKKNKPSVRVVLLKGIGNKGITFFTNYNSRKGQDLAQNSSASLLFYWAELERQVRVEGNIKKISLNESKKYFNSRPIESRIAAWASEQSKKISDREYLEGKFAEYKNKFSEKKIPIPPNWGGYLLTPTYFEFWQGRESRLHDRICYRRNKNRWEIFRLAP